MPCRSQDRLADRLAAIAQGHKGRVAYAVKHLDFGETVHTEADEALPTASLIKFPVMLDAWEAASESRQFLHRLRRKHAT